MLVDRIPFASERRTTARHCEEYWLLKDFEDSKYLTMKISYENKDIAKSRLKTIHEVIRRYNLTIWAKATDEVVTVFKNIPELDFKVSYCEESTEFKMFSYDEIKMHLDRFILSEYKNMVFRCNNMRLANRLSRIIRGYNKNEQMNLWMGREKFDIYLKKGN